MARADADHEAQRRRLMLLCKRIGMTREERLDFAEQLLATDVESWTQLTPEQVARLLDGVEGFVFLQALLLQRF